MCWWETQLFSYEWVDCKDGIWGGLQVNMCLFPRLQQITCSFAPLNTDDYKLQERQR